MADNGKILKIVGCGCLGLVVVAVAAVIFIVLGLFGVLKKATPYADSLEAVQSNPGAIEALGEPIDPGFVVSGSVNLNNDDGDAALSYPVSGPNGKGTVKVTGKKAAGQWSYETMELQVEGGETIDLQAAP